MNDTRDLKLVKQTIKEIKTLACLLEDLGYTSEAGVWADTIETAKQELELIEDHIE